MCFGKKLFFFNFTFSRVFFNFPVKFEKIFWNFEFTLLYWNWYSILISPLLYWYRYFILISIFLIHLVVLIHEVVQQPAFVWPAVSSCNDHHHDREHGDDHEEGDGHDDELSLQTSVFVWNFQNFLNPKSFSFYISLHKILLRIQSGFY